jgi:hypothetical protein
LEQSINHEKGYLDEILSRNGAFIPFSLEEAPMIVQDRN